MFRLFLAHRTLALALAATVVAASLNFIATRGAPQIGHDSFFYLQMTEHLAQHWPRKLGVAWPFGYPLLASLLVRAGIHSYTGATAISWLSFAAAIGLFIRLLADAGVTWRRSVGLALGVACLPAVFRSAGGVQSESLFTALVCAQAFCLQRANARGYWLGSLALTVALLGARYVGVAFIALPTVWLAIHWNKLPSAERVVRSAGLIATTAVLSAF